MADSTDVSAALLARCQAMADDLGLPISMPDVAFTPGENNGEVEPYLSAELFFNAPRFSSLNDSDVSQGLLQITVVYPKNQGIASQRMADNALAHFPKALRLPAGVKIGAGWIASPIREAAETRVPVTIPWTA